MNSDFNIQVAKLNGYLDGTAAMDGRIRQYTAEAYFIACESDSESPRDAVRNFFASQAKLEFSGETRIKDGLRELERRLGDYLVRRPWGFDEHFIAQELIEARRAYLALRVMDFIEEIGPEARNLCDVTKMETKVSGSPWRASIFCVRIQSGFLVVQFNEYLNASEPVTHFSAQL